MDGGNVVELLDQLSMGAPWSKSMVSFLFSFPSVMGVEQWKENKRVFAQGIAIGFNDTWHVESFQLSDGEYRALTKVPNELLWNEVRRLLRAVDKIVNDHEGFKIAASHDPLTGALNRKGLEDWFAKRVKRSELELGFVLALLDLDRFKELNDTKGHLVGDEALKAIVRTLKEVLRSSDVVARLGGDEFVFIMDNLSCHPLAKVRLEEIVEMLPLDEYGLGLTLGAVCYPKHGGELKRLIAGADKLLYQGKANGKNQVVVWKGELDTNG